MTENLQNEEEFIAFLQEGTKDFKMYPQRKVWYSLYNEMHPGRKWPSVAVCLLLIFGLLYLGVSNNNSINKQHVMLSEKQVLLSPTENLFSRVNVSKNQKSVATVNLPLISSRIAIEEMSESNDILTTLSEDESKLHVLQNDAQNEVSNVVSLENSIAKEKIVIQNNSSEISTDKSVVQITAVEKRKNKLLSASSESLNILSPVLTKAKEVSADRRPITSFVPDRAFIDHFAFYNKRKTNRFFGRSSILYYVAPTAGFRWLEQKNVSLPVTTSAAQFVVTNNTAATRQEPRDINNQVTQRYAVNLEAGAVLIYNLSKNVKLRGGLQYNYTNYEIKATLLNHSVLSQLAFVKSAVARTEAVSTNYANGINNTSTLNNSTHQLSIPLGVDVRVAEINNRVEWFVSGTVQPTLIQSKNVYVLSSDARNYINAPRLLRNFNINTGFETFLKIKAGNGLYILAGPQVRYQLRSSYKDKFSYSEKLYNAGVKVGISKKL